MDGEVLITSFGSPLDAELARLLLESHQIECRIADDMLVASAMHIETAFGGVKLFVGRADAEQAAALLAEHQRTLRAERSSPEASSERVSRALRCAFVAFVIFPVVLHVWSLWLLGRVDYHSLPPRARKSYWLTMALDLSVIVAAAVLLASAIRS
jgi:hypothetical protein